jgi:hypothetical protein
MGQWNIFWEYLEEPIIIDASKRSVYSTSGMWLILSHVFGGLSSNLALVCIAHHVNKCYEIGMQYVHEKPKYIELLHMIFGSSQFL